MSHIIWHNKKCRFKDAIVGVYKDAYKAFNLISKEGYLVSAEEFCLTLRH